MKRKIILLIVLTIITLFSCDKIISNFMSTIVKKSNFRYSKLYTNRAQSDILIVGNSRSLGLFVPYIQKQTNKKTFSLSYNSLTTELSLALLKDYYKKYNPPKLIIIEVSMRESKPKLNSTFKIYKQFSDNISNVIKKTNESTYFYDNIFNIYRYNTELFQRTLYYINKSDINWINNRKINKYKLAESIIPEKYNYTQKLLNDFKEIKTLCEAHGTKCVFLLMPYHPKYQMKYTNLNDYIYDLESTLNTKIYDYRNVLKNNNYFADFIHINKDGAKQITKILYNDNVFKLK